MLKSPTLSNVVSSSGSAASLTIIGGVFIGVPAKELLESMSAMISALNILNPSEAAVEGVDIRDGDEISSLENLLVVVSNDNAGVGGPLLDPLRGGNDGDAED